MVPDSNEFYTPEEISRLLKVSRRLVYQLLNSGELPGIKVGRHWRISHEALDEYVLWKSVNGKGAGRWQASSSASTTPKEG